MTDRSDAVVITARTQSRATRHTYEPRTDGRYDHIEAVQTTAGEWREVGHEVVETLAVETL
jgi:hypothetical protein